MSDRRITIRLSEADYQTLQAKATAAGTSLAETARTLALRDNQTDALADLIASCIERIEALEAPGDIGHLVTLIEDISTAQRRQESNLLALVTAVENLHQPVAREPQTAPPSETTSPALATLPIFTQWVIRQPLLPGETPPQRADRLRPEYNRLANL